MSKMVLQVSVGKEGCVSKPTVTRGQHDKTGKRKSQDSQTSGVTIRDPQRGDIY